MAHATIILADTVGTSSSMQPHTVVCGESELMGYICNTSRSKPTSWRNRQRDRNLKVAPRPTPTTCTMLRLCVLIVGLLVVMVSYGCNPSYTPITVETPDGRVVYNLLARLEDDTFRTTLTRRQDDRSISRSLDGKGEGMALSPKGDILAVALFGAPWGDIHRVMILHADTLRVVKELPIIMPEVATDPDGYAPSIQRVDCIALSNDSKRLAMYFTTFSRRGGYDSIFTLWDTETGGLLREMRIPNPDTPTTPSYASGSEVSSMGFSPDGSLLGVSGVWAWPIKIPNAEQQPDGFIKVWRIADGKDVAMLRPKGHVFLWSLCFDGKACHVAAWDWIGHGTEDSAVSIWSLPEGEKVAEKVFPGRVRSITWVHEREAFAIQTAKEGTKFVQPESQPSSRQGNVTVKEQ